MRPAIGKLDAVKDQLEAAVLLSLMGGNSVAIHTLTWASRGILRDLHKVEANPLISRIEDSVGRMVRPGKEAEWRRYENRAANFFKHADRDPTDVLQDVNLDGINEIELLLAILAYGQITGSIGHKLAVGLAFLGFSSGDWFDFEGYTSGLQGNTMDYQHYAGMDEVTRRKLFLKAFLHLSDPDTFPI